MASINYITNLNVDNFSGGWSGMNHYIYHQLKTKFEIRLIQDVNPPYSFREKLQSKLCRLSGMKGIFPAFTNKRLTAISNIVNSKLTAEGNFNFFHGATSWLHINSSFPYALYLDASFASYIKVYHDKRQFSPKQLNSIYQKEAEFLNNANAVFFSSKWAMDDAISSYHLSGHNFHVAGLGGGLGGEVSKNSQEPKPYFLFVGLDFIGKGGDIVVNAFSEIQKKFPHFRLKIAGQKPPKKFLKYPNIEYVGFINKANEAELQKITSLFTRSYCLLLPTSKDMTPLVLIEAGSVGCPVIATESFGIPEIVENEKTGLLIKTGPSIKTDLQNAMIRLCENPTLRDKLGRNAVEHIKNNFSWNRTGAKIIDILSTIF